jgi:hypothetical protein
MRTRRRIERSAGAASALRDEVMSWLDKRRHEQAFIRFGNHFDVLTVVFSRMLGGILDALESESAAPLRSSGEVYERCRRLDDSLVVVRRAYEWYAGKYDQRLDSRLSPALRAADEIVRSCWHSAFESRGLSPPAGPLPYFDARFDSYATSRRTVPLHIKAPPDAPFDDLIDALPVPVTALPLWASAESWWLVLAAHETGHHVQKDLGLEAPTRAALPPHWVSWSRELFADAFSVVMVGAAAIAPVEELEHATPRRMTAAPQPGDLYPPPLVRLELLAELAAVPKFNLARTSLTASALTPYRDAVPAVSAALLELLGCNGTKPAWEAGRVAAWRHRLRARDPILSRLETRAAARYLIAAGVAAYADASPDEWPVVHENLLRFLPECGPDGTLGSAPPAPDVAALADRLTASLTGDGSLTGGGT